ncbi:MAG: hypothetical protein EBR94_02615 [Bacteroidetes bacterium]|jgi:hypothetical protein|nr:hypothetical protein [Bacteroidota bacterium]
MRQFLQLVDALGASKNGQDKYRIWVDFQRNLSNKPNDLATITALLKNDCPQPLISAKQLKQLALETTGIPEWLLVESKRFVGDMSETLALILTPLQSSDSSEIQISQLIASMDEMREGDKNTLRSWIVGWWQSLSTKEIQLFNKLITGSFKSPVGGDFLSGLALQRDCIELKVVLLYAERGRSNGRNGFTEFTMGIGSELGWVTFSKVGVELPEEERDSIEQWIVENTQEKFGPVHRLPAVQVFTIECGSIEESKRTKSGYSVKDAVMKSWEIGSPMEVVADKSTISAILPKR